MLHRQWLAIHTHREQGIPAVVDGFDREADREIVDRAADELLRIVANPGPVQHVSEGHAEPASVPDEVAADLVGDTGQGHVLLHQRHVEKIEIGDRVWAIDPPLDAQGPLLDVDARNPEECGVDPIEDLVRGDHGAEALDPELGGLRDRGQSLGGGGKGDVGAARRPIASLD